MVGLRGEKQIAGRKFLSQEIKGTEGVNEYLYNLKNMA